MNKLSERFLSLGARLFPGVYVLDKNIALSYLRNISITGASGDRKDVKIHCENGKGFTFIRGEGFVLESFSVSNCGSTHLSTSLYNITFDAAFQFVYCRDITFHDVSVSNNSAIGVNFYDVGGEVKFIKSEFSSNKNPDKYARGDGAQEAVSPGGGGGLYVQFTYCGAFYGDGCNSEDNAEHEKYIHGNQYLFENCVFSDNFAPGPPSLPGKKNTDFLPPQGRDHMSLGRGGGLSIYIRGNASKNTFIVKGCNFTDNYGQWGGGFFTELVDSCSHNKVLITGSYFARNKAKWAGGGMRYGLIQVFAKIKPYNNGTFINCIFVDNFAIWGGATSIYSTEETLTNDGKATSEIIFSGVKWLRNSASNGAAVGCASWKIIIAGGIVLPEFRDCVFHENKITDYRMDDSINMSSAFSYSVVDGQGTICTSAMPLHFWGDNKFVANLGTTILLMDATMSADGNLEFIRNAGHNGGGIALLGESWIIIHPGSTFLFSKNSAMRGAGIYVQTPGTPNRVASKNCFITYGGKTTAQSLISPEQWKTHFNFSYNNATVAGHAIYSSTLQYCQWYMEVYGFKSRQLFNWTNFVYENESPLSGFEIATDPVSVAFDKHDWLYLSPSDVINPTVKLSDERQQVLPGIVNVRIENSNLSNTEVDVSSGPYFPAEGNIYSFKLKGKDHVPFSITIQTVTGRIIKGIIPRVTMLYCRPGYYMSRNNTCVCLKEVHLPLSTFADARGITRCQGDRNVFIRKGLWAGTIDDSPAKFVTYTCPTMYCNFSCQTKEGCAPHEYLYLNDPEQQCTGYRTGVLCGECRKGYSVVLGSEACKRCTKGYAWIGYFIVFLIVGALLVFGILFLNVNISTGHYTGCMFFYQVVSLLVRDGFQPDPVLSFLIGLANAQVGVGACMWYGMTGLGKLAITYVLPTYILFLCAVVIYLSRKPCCVFSRRSALRSFSTLFLISYTTYTSVSLELLHYATLHHKTVLFKSGDVEFFKGLHLGFGILAIFVCAIIVLPFPFFLVLVQPVSFVKPGFAGGKLKAFVDIFQGGYKTEYRWFSGVYYLARITLLVVYIFSFDAGIKHTTLAVLCLLLLTLQTNIRPYGSREGSSDSQYKRTWINLLDSLILTDLTIIALLGSFSSSNDSYLTSNLSFGYSPADVICLILMWIPAVYFFWILGINLHRSWKKRLDKIRQDSQRYEATSPTSETPSFAFDDDITTNA